VIERLIENWLDKATERSYQIPFCHMLAAKGYTVVHLSRHCGMELGKDILAIAPDAIPCAYQLKTARDGKITLKQWREEISRQVVDLVAGKIIHPSVESAKHHRAYLVTNGELEEEVMRAIDDMNRGWVDSGQAHLKLHTIVKGELFKMAQELQTDFWPSEISNVKTFLELFLENGRGIVPKEKLASLFEAAFPFTKLETDKSPSQAECGRILASGALLCSVAISNFSNEDNYVAEIEAWTMYVSYLLGLVERWNLPFELWRNEFEIATKSIYNSLSNLCEELRKRKHLVEGHPYADAFVYSVRLTWLIGFMSIYALWRRNENQPESEVDEFIMKFCSDNKTKLYLWGEAAIPQFLAFYWYFRNIDSTVKPDLLLRDLIHAISKCNHPKGKNPLANPYYEAFEILPYMLGIAEEPLQDTFNGYSYTIEGLVHLFIRRNWKQTMKLLWPDITRLKFEIFEPENNSDFYRWRNQKGTHKTILPKHRQEWKELQTLASESNGECIPSSIKNYPVLLLLFLCVYPHRINSEILRWLDTKLMKI
jgi:hypothetical protein